MKATARKPIDGTYRSWSDGRQVHLIVRFSGGNLGRGPVTMHATTDLAPARAAVRRRFVTSGDTVLAGDPVATEALATRVGLFSAFRRIGRAAQSAASLATAPVRALAGAGVNSLKTTANLAKGIESATALTAYVTKPLGWRPGRKRSGPPAPAATADRPADTESAPPDQEDPMNDETSGNPKPQADQVRKASGLLRRASANPKSARHVKNIAKAAAAGHPGAQLAQAAIVEARRKQPTTPGKVPLPAVPPLPSLVRPMHTAFSSWARGAA
jgi:hypothetical protein